jgi:hypothetical protein
MNNAAQVFEKNSEGQFVLPPRPEPKTRLPDLPKLNGREAIEAIREQQRGMYVSEDKEEEQLAPKLSEAQQKRVNDLLARVKAQTGH